jgi:hypothetical protein
MKNRKMQKPKLFFIFGGFFIIALLGIIIYVDARANPPFPNSRTLDRLHKEQTQLANDNISPAEKTFIAYKIREDEWFLTPDVENEKVSEVNPLQLSPVPTRIGTPRPSLGIFQGGFGQFNHQIIGPITTWRGKINEELVQIMAGTSPQNSDQGIIIVEVFTKKNIGHDYTHKFDVSNQSGNIAIVSEDNNRLTLKSAQGQEFYFDVPSMSFVDSLSVQVTPIFDQLISGTPLPQSAAPALTTPEPAYP